MKKFGEVDILSRLDAALQKMVDNNADITEKVTVICQYFEGGSEDMSNMMRIKFAFDSSTSEINECISTLNGINQIVAIPDIQKSLNNRGALSTTFVGTDSDDNLTVNAFIMRDVFEETNLYKSLIGIGKYDV